MLQWLLDNLGEDTGTWRIDNAKDAGLETSEVYMEYVKAFKATTFRDFFRQMKEGYRPGGRAYVKKRQRKQPMEPPNTSVTNVPASFPTTSSTPLPTSSLKKRKSSGHLAEDSNEPPSPHTSEASPTQPSDRRVSGKRRVFGTELSTNGAVTNC
jgi:hypothetical protein